ncbi:hypothetical protein FQR65_LT20722 [Abscondita terminalis]|nr:hypothetical protein FQR65_LT20722 [Abscondita terminalis]
MARDQSNGLNRDEWSKRRQSSVSAAWSCRRPSSCLVDGPRYRSRRSPGTGEGAHQESNLKQSALAKRLASMSEGIEKVLSRDHARMLAAKAAGVECTANFAKRWGFLRRARSSAAGGYPLADDGDALRLAEAADVHSTTTTSCPARCSCVWARKYLIRVHLASMRQAGGDRKGVIPATTPTQRARHLQAAAEIESHAMMPAPHDSASIAEAAHASAVARRRGRQRVLVKPQAARQIRDALVPARARLVRLHVPGPEIPLVGRRDPGHGALDSDHTRARRVLGADGQPAAYPAAARGWPTSGWSRAPRPIAAALERQTQQEARKCS